MFVSDNGWIKEAWKRETRKECNSVEDEIILTMLTKGKTVQFKGEDMKLEGKKYWTENSNQCGTSKKYAKKVLRKKGIEEKRLEQYTKKEMQSEIYKKHDKKCNIWLEQNLTPRKT